MGDELIPILASKMGSEDPNGKLPGWMIAVGLIVLIGVVGLFVFGILTGRM
jgi:hypothetical protein